ncbi:LacI family transcriptional regulator [Nocardioides anomalus]|uniref:LacI family transcriptional regulator n=1 Tax=Nocardioides anomalus TaxID=2712223 RepID=A0A6G6WDK8_9ACTN|nr:LacI family DNA-binding transcriptional regulator [Nocardioides anomalus]QIG43185.1 LacI family transcriptional regulator [Nocardioides anomalus]
MPTPVTLRDVAAATGVHASTVSRILRGDRHRVRPETAERVLSYAAEVGYTANRWAASLRSGRTNVLGMLVPRITDAVLATVFESFEQAAARAGFMSLVASTRDVQENRAEGIRRFVEQRVDGIVVADARLTDPELLAIHAAGTPLVLASRRTAGIPFVVSDDVGGGRLAGRHVGDSGAHRVAVLAGPEYASTATERTEGFLAGLAESGGPHEVTVRHSGFDLEAGQATMEEILSHEEKPDAVFAVNDFAAIGAMSTLARHGLQPGRDVAVVGYNDIAISGELLVPLTSVRADLDAMGRLAFESVRSAIEGQPVPDHLVPTELVVRESSVGPGRR